MGYELQKRLDLLKDQADDARRGRLGFFKLCVLCFLALWAVSRPLSIAPPDELAGEVYIRQQISERVDWLSRSWFGGARSYERFALHVFDSFIEGADASADEGLGVDSWLSYSFGGMLLRLSFLFFASWPLWALGFIAGVFFFRSFLIPRRGDDILGVLTRTSGPFYSGIYGPLVSNSSASGTELACPSLACPKMESRVKALAHPLVSLLKEYGALNQTNLELVQIILAYRDYPATVDEERVIDDEPEESGLEHPYRPAPNNVRTTEQGTLEKSALDGLCAILAAQRVLTTLYPKNVAGQLIGEEHFAKHLGTLGHLARNLPPLSRRLLFALTPTRAAALASLAPAAIVSAYLSTEAGKSLVYKRDAGGFVPISRFPHLQARAVLQSTISYNKEYRGDQRLVIRQAILCSRRHGDFGRTFLPVNTPIVSRALRDWLEILYAAPKRRDDVAYLVELDSHLEEISVHWRKQFMRRLEGENQIGEHPLWKGFPFKSVVLMPLRELLMTALGGLSPLRLERISELMKLTRKLQSSLSISARLPGFKRQAVEAERSGIESGGITSQLAQHPENVPLVEGWLITRRLLTKYNWLSTRVGDDAVPEDGLVQALVIDRTTEKPRILPLDALVPLRQRRFSELLGARWESLYYTSAPPEIEVFVESEEYKRIHTLRAEQAEKGQLEPRSATSLAGSS